MQKPVRVGVVFTAIVFIAGAATIWAQRPGGQGRPQQSQSYSGNVRYDGKFVFVRMSYQSFSRMQAPWAHDYPDG